MPFSIVSGQPFWSIFESNAIICNGYDDLPEQIGRMLLVKGSLTNLELVPTSSRGYGVARLHVTDTLTIADLLALPPSPRPTTEMLGKNGVMHDMTVVRSGDLVYIYRNFEGDVGSWALLYDTPDVTDLLIRSIWEGQQDVFWAGRVRLRQGRSVVGGGSPFGSERLPNSWSSRPY